MMNHKQKQERGVSIVQECCEIIDSLASEIQSAEMWSDIGDHSAAFGAFKSAVALSRKITVLCAEGQQVFSDGDPDAITEITS